MTYTQTYVDFFCKKDQKEEHHLTIVSITDDFHSMLL